jgi:small subunit ribosomal protein S6
VAQRAYELMVIFDGGLDEAGYQTNLKWVEKLITDASGTVHKTDPWGRRTFAYEINHKTEGYYAVYELMAEGGALDHAERSLRLADAVVRHKLLRLPEHEAARRGLVAAPA